MTKKDLKTEVEAIINATFQDNPSVLRTIKQDKKWKKRLKALVNYSFETAYMRNGVFISENRKGAALCYNPFLKKEGLVDYYNQAKLAIKAIGLERVYSILKREAYVKQFHPKTNYFHFWFLGVLPEARNAYGALSELKNKIYALADKNKYAIYLETSIKKNVKLYQLGGFELYHTWDENGKSPTLYFMRRLPNEQQN